MDFQIIPVAEASVVTLMKSINKVIINPLIFFLFAVAMIYFLYGLAQYFLSPDNEEVRKTSKSHMIWGVVGLFIMVAVFGILNLITGTIGGNNLKFDSAGNYEVNQGTSNTSTGTKAGGLNRGSSQGDTVAPDPGGLVGGGFSDEKAPTPQQPQAQVLPAITDESEMAVPPEILAFKSDASFWRAYGSGKKNTLAEARETAIRNAQIRIAGMKGSTSIAGINYTTPKEGGAKAYNSSDGFYHYFIVISSYK